MSTLKERIAALQANSGASQSTVSSRPPSSSSSPSADPNAPPVGRLRDKIARFDGLGGAPVPRSSFGLPAPPPVSISRSVSVNQGGELWGKRLDPGRPSVNRSASLRLPRTSSDSASSDLPSTDSPAPFETVPLRVRTISNFSTKSAFEAGPLLSPSQPTELSHIQQRRASLRAVSPTPSTLSSNSLSRFGVGTSLTVAAVSTLPTSPSFKPSDATSSLATDLDLQNDKPSLTPFETPAASASASLRSSPIPETPSNVEASRPRGNTITANDSGPGEVSSKASSAGSTSTRDEELNPHLQPRPSTPSYIAQNLMRESPNESHPRPSTPSYLAQAASYFPPARSSNRQSVYLPRSYSPSPSTPPRAPSVSISSSPSPSKREVLRDIDAEEDAPLPLRTPPRKSSLSTQTDAEIFSSSPRSQLSSLLTDDETSASARASIDTTYFSIENEGGLSDLVPDLRVDGRRVGIEDSQSGANSPSGPRGAPSPISNVFLDSFPSPPHVSTLQIDANASPSFKATESGESPLPTPPPTARPPPHQFQSKGTLSPSSTNSSFARLQLSPRGTSHVGASSTSSTSPPQRKPRPKSQLLIPGKWINSDDEDEDDGDDEDGGRGWARIVVSSRSR